MRAASLIDSRGEIVDSVVFEDDVSLSVSVLVFPEAKPGWRVKVTGEDSKVEWFRLIDKEQYKREKKSCIEVFSSFGVGDLLGMRLLVEEDGGI